MLTMPLFLPPALPTQVFVAALLAEPRHLFFLDVPPATVACRAFLLPRGDLLACYKIDKRRGGGTLVGLVAIGAEIVGGGRVW